MWLRSCGEICHVETFLHMTDFSTFLHIPHFAPHLNFLYMIDCLHISHVEKLLHMKICHMETFLHMTEFFSTSTACGACDKYPVCFCWTVQLWSQFLVRRARVRGPAVLKFAICLFEHPKWKYLIVVLFSWHKYKTKNKETRHPVLTSVQLWSRFLAWQAGKGAWASRPLGWARNFGARRVLGAWARSGGRK